MLQRINYNRYCDTAASNYIMKNAKKVPIPSAPFADLKSLDALQWQLEAFHMRNSMTARHEFISVSGQSLQSVYMRKPK